jgi:multiple RNA-binding domain-containing protein 1
MTDVSDTPTSRLIVKGLPKHLKDERLKEHFGTKGMVTDAKIMMKGNKSRLFGFVGFKSEEEAAAARKFFNKTFLDTSKIEVDFAKPQNDPTIARPWSKYSKGSSAFAMNSKDGKA